MATCYSPLQLLFFLLVPIVFGSEESEAMSSSANAAPPRPRVAIVTGGTRGIGRGIAEALASHPTSPYRNLLLTYNSNRAAAETFVSELEERYGTDSSPLRVELVGGDISLQKTRDAIFHCFDDAYGGTDACDLGVLVHNAGQYVGITSTNAAGIESGAPSMSSDKKKAEKQEGDSAPPPPPSFGDGSMISTNRKGKEEVDFGQMHYYQRMYGDAFVDLCERSLARMRTCSEKHYPSGGFRGSLIGISSPGCNAMRKPIPTYSLPGSGKCVMEYAMRIYALRAAPLGVNCNVIVPGVVTTEAWQRIEESRGMEKGALLGQVSNFVPMGKAIEPTEIGEVVAFLCDGNGGGRYVTGVSLPVDGGSHLR